MRFLKRLFKFMIRAIIILALIFLALFIISNKNEIFRKLNIDFKPVPKVIKALESDTKKFLEENYSGYYEISGFKIMSTEETERGIEYTAKFNMKLIKNPKEIPFIEGFREFADNEEKKNYFKFLEESIKSHYNKKEKTTLSFILVKGEDFSGVKLPLHGSEIELSSLKIDESRLRNLGRSAAKEYKKRVSSSKYDPNMAVEYAVKHYKDSPTYQNDCANFVSTAINEAGIEKTSEWKEESINWVSTGFKNNGTGLVPYLLKKNEFYQEKYRGKVREGSIVFWNDVSHVGLITYQDTITMKYTAHTRARRNEILPLGSKTNYYTPMDN